MRLYLSAESKNKVGYTPDWVQVSYEDENGKGISLTFDIRGEIDYDRDTLSCRCKGDLIPWALWPDDEDEVDLSEMDEDELNALYPVTKIIDIFNRGYDFTVGIYPVDDTESNEMLVDTDILINCKGKLEMYDEENDEILESYFEFGIEVND